MSQQKKDTFTISPSDAEKQGIERFKGSYRERPVDGLQAVRDPIQIQLDSVTQRLTDLTEMVLNIERQTAHLVEIIRLSHQKSELLGQRLDAVIAALKKASGVR